MKLNINSHWRVSPVVIFSSHRSSSQKYVKHRDENQKLQIIPKVGMLAPGWKWGRKKRMRDQQACWCGKQTLHLSIVVKGELSQKMRLPVCQSIYIHKLWVVIERIRCRIRVAKKSLPCTEAGLSLRVPVHTTISASGYDYSISQATICICFTWCQVWFVQTVQWWLLLNHWLQLMRGCRRLENCVISKCW